MRWERRRLFLHWKTSCVCVCVYVWLLAVNKHKNKDLLCTNMQLQKHVSVASHSRYTEGLIQGDARQIDRMHR